MFYKDGILERSTLLSGASVAHGFSTRRGGVSTHPYTAAMNLAMGREDPDGTVRENMEIFARAVTGGSFGGESVVTASQIHSAKVRVVTADNRGEGVYLQGPIQFDFGTHIRMGKGSYANFNFVVLDENRVTIGDHVFIGPNCSILTPLHPLCHEDRNTGVEYSAPVTIEDNCWIGGNVTILPGVTIGHGSVIGAGAVVTKSVPPDSLAFGSPCRVVRSITEADRLSEHPELFAE